jgi:hypothetical protein
MNLWIPLAIVCCFIWGWWGLLWALLIGYMLAPRR